VGVSGGMPKLPDEFLNGEWLPLGDSGSAGPGWPSSSTSASESKSKNESASVSMSVSASTSLRASQLWYFPGRPSVAPASLMRSLHRRPPGRCSLKSSWMRRSRPRQSSWCTISDTAFRCTPWTAPTPSPNSGFRSICRIELFARRASMAAEVRPILARCPRFVAAL